MNIRATAFHWIVASLWLLLPREAAAFSTNDQATITAALMTARGWLNLPPAVDAKIGIRPVMGYERPQLVVAFQVTTDELEISLSAKGGRLIQVNDLALRREIAKRSEAPIHPARLTKAEAERMALAAAEKIGVKVDKDFRPWERFGSAPPNNYDAKDQEWRFYWTRHIADFPVANESLSVCIDDRSGKISSLRNGVRNTYFPAPIGPTIRIADARDKATDVAKKLWPKDGDGRSQLWDAYRVVGGNPLCYYLQEELDPAILRQSTQAGPGLKLRLVFIILIGKNLPDSSLKTGQWFSTHHKVMIDATTGEHVPSNE